MRRRGIGVLLSLALLGVSLGLSAPAAADVYRVGLADSGFPPYSYLPRDHRVGLFMQILNEIGAGSGDRFVEVYAPTKRLQQDFAKGRIDIEPGINPLWRPDQAKISAYTEPFTDLVSCLLFHAGVAQLLSLKDFVAGVSVQADGRPIGFLDPKVRLVGTVRGYRYQIFDAGFASGTLQRVDTEGEKQLIMMLDAKRFDATAMAVLPARYFVHELERIRPMHVMFGEETDRTPIMFRVQKKHAGLVKRLNAGIKKMVAAGRIKAIEAAFEREQ